MSIDKLYLEQTFSRIRDLAAELRGDLSRMERRTLEDKAALMALRFTALDQMLSGGMELPVNWEKSAGSSVVMELPDRELCSVQNCTHYQWWKVDYEGSSKSRDIRFTKFEKCWYHHYGERIPR